MKRDKKKLCVFDFLVNFFPRRLWRFLNDVIKARSHGMMNNRAGEFLTNDCCRPWWTVRISCIYRPPLFDKKVSIWQNILFRFFKIYFWIRFYWPKYIQIACDSKQILILCFSAVNHKRFVKKSIFHVKLSAYELCRGRYI